VGRVIRGGGWFNYWDTVRTILRSSRRSLLRHRFSVSCVPKRVIAIYPAVACNLCLRLTTSRRISSSSSIRSAMRSQP
jgi:hypothetical protein